MTKPTASSVFIFVLFVLISSFFTANSWSTNGTPTMKTGSPGDGGNTCISTCHALKGTDIGLIPNVITTDIPISGYISGETYNITVSNMGIASAYRYGFSITSEDDLDNKAGEFIEGSNTKLLSVNFISHDTAHIGNNPNWTFKWIAPTIGTGDVTFYTAFIGGDGTLGARNDTGGIAFEKVIESSFNNIEDQRNESTFNSWVESTTGDLIYEYSAQEPSLIQVELFDITGKLIIQRDEFMVDSGKFTKRNSLPKNGIYLFRISVDSEKRYQKLMVRMKG